ncbi:MAG: substrate-binding domain-containing protein [Treponema sp.]|nr:substrate-binding domain-containing protein [Treponema sp.]
MGKKFFLPALFSVLILAACSPENHTEADSVSGATSRRGPVAPVLLSRYMPAAMADGIVKIAVLVNMEAGDNSRQFIEGCISSGRAMGFTVDAFVSGGDETKCGEIAAGIARADYDGLIFSHGEVDFSYDILRPIADAGVQIVTFEALPYRDGKSIKGLVTTFQDDYRLAKLSLEAMLASVHGEEGRPLRVVRVGCDPGITFLDRRAWEFDRLKSQGKIAEAAFVRMSDMENPRAKAQYALASALPRFPHGSVDALWVPWNDFAAGCAEALAAAGRDDIKLFSVGISNDDLRTMQRNSSIWLASTAIDPKLAGTVNMRILAAKLAGETVPETFSFDPQLIKTADLNPAVNISNIAMIVPGWGGGEGLFDQYQWMADLKLAEGRYLRLPPEASPQETMAK